MGFFDNRKIRTLLLSTLVVVYFLSMVGVILYVAQLQKQVVETSALEHANLYSQAISEFRTLYTKEVVAKAQQSGMKVSHKFKGVDNTIPLPATLSMLLGKQIGESYRGASTKLYSAYPFPWRKNSGGLQDQFARDAWMMLQKNPHKPYYQFTTIEGKPVIRYATADLMRQSCVECHNTHPDTPKTGWQTGDLRGVLEVTQPLQNVSAFAAHGLRNMIFYLCSIALLAIIAVFFIVRYFQKNESYLDRTIKKRTDEIVAAEQRNTAIREQLLQSQKLESIGMLAGGVAHDFNNMLTAIITSLELLKNTDSNDTKKFNKYIQLAENATKQSTSLVQKLLGFARKGKYEKVNININELIGETVELLERTINRRIKIKLDFPPNIWIIQGDPSQLSQVIMNLAMNAAEAMPGGGTMTLSTRNMVPDSKLLSQFNQLQKTNYVHFSINDTGIGIPSNIIQTIFEPFVSTKSPTKGTGLGLAMVFGIVENHNGAITVQSKSNIGTTFDLYFLALDDADASQQVPAAAKITSPIQKEAKLTAQGILVVDDETTLCELAEEMIHANNEEIKIFVANSGNKAVNLFKSSYQNIDLIILDIILPDIDGFDVFKACRDIDPNIPVLFYSGYAESDRVNEYRLLGNADFIQKPFNRELFINKLRALLAKRT